MPGPSKMILRRFLRRRRLLAVALDIAGGHFVTPAKRTKLSSNLAQCPLIKVTKSTPKLVLEGILSP